MSAAIFPAFDTSQIKLSQYASSPKLMALVDNLSAYFDPTANLTNFYNMLWNIDTAVGVYQDIWGRILGVGRFLTLPAAGPYFGFSNDGVNDFTGFGQATFYGGPSSTTTFRLGDPVFRQVLLAKAFANICRCTAPVMNQLLRILFSDSGNAWVTDSGGMAMTYAFDFMPNPVQQAMVTQLGILPRPAGVVVTITTDLSFEIMAENPMSGNIISEAGAAIVSEAAP
jgi:hypothetical protein